MQYDFSQTIDRSATNAQKYLLVHQLFGTEDLIPAWVADMDLPTPEFVLDAIQKRLMHPIFGYESFAAEAIKAQTEWIARHHAKQFKAEDFFFSPSVVTSISCAIMAFTQQGDEVIVQPPVYPPFFQQVKKNRRTVIKNALTCDENGVWRFDLKDLRRKITPKTKLLLLCNPHNPVGRAWQKEELEALLEICLEHNIIIFSDEIHSDLVFAPNRHTPLASLKDASALCISAYGVGKTFNMAGFATSSLYIEESSLKEKFAKQYEAIHFAQGNTFGHIGFFAAYTQGDAWLKQLKAHLWQNYTMLLEALHPFHELIRVTPLEATYLAWLDCRNMHLQDKAMRQWFIQEAKLGLNPGIAFGKEGSGYMRLNFAVSTKMMQEIISRLTKALRNYETKLGRV